MLKLIFSAVDSKTFQHQLAGKFNAENIEFALENDHFDKKMSMEETLLVNSFSMTHSIPHPHPPHVHPHHRKLISIVINVLI